MLSAASCAGAVLPEGCPASPSAKEWPSSAQDFGDIEFRPPDKISHSWGRPEAPLSSSACTQLRFGSCQVHEFLPSVPLPPHTMLRLHFISPGRCSGKGEISKMWHFSTYFWSRLEKGNIQIRSEWFLSQGFLPCSRLPGWSYGVSGGLRRGLDQAWDICTEGSLVMTTASSVPLFEAPSAKLMRHKWLGGGGYQRFHS